MIESRNAADFSRWGTKGDFSRGIGFENHKTFKLLLELDGTASTPFCVQIPFTFVINTGKSRQFYSQMIVQQRHLEEGKTKHILKNETG